MRTGKDGFLVGALLLIVLACSCGSALAGPPADKAATVAEGVDKLLASQLFDPTSAIQYRVSAPVSCEQVMDGFPAGTMCVCYAVNAKNRYGAYAGATLYAAPYAEINGNYMVLPGFEVEGKAEAACEKSGMSVRPASKIADRVSK